MLIGHQVDGGGILVQDRTLTEDTDKTKLDYGEGIDTEYLPGCSPGQWSRVTYKEYRL